MAATTENAGTGGEGELAERMRAPGSRKQFLALVGLGGAGLLSACGSSKTESEKQLAPVQQTAETNQFGQGDVGILNYALTLEFLEADFYEQVIKSGEVKDRRLLSLFKKIGENEVEHVQILKATVKQTGGQPAAPPKTAFDEVLATGERGILSTAATIENLGASAYLGQANKVQDPRLLDAALRIHTIEARHAAALNHLAGRDFRGSGQLIGSVPDGAFAKPMPASAVLREAGKFIQS